MEAHQHARVLLIDDDPLFGGILCRKGAVRGLQVDYSGSLVEALYGNLLEDYDVAIVDCNMPGIDGFEVSHYISTFLHDVPVVLVSQSLVPFRRFLEDPNGAQAFVSKERGTEAILSAAMQLVEINHAPAPFGL